MTDAAAAMSPGLAPRERAAILLGLAGTAIISWAYVWFAARGSGDGGMASMAGMAMPAEPTPWDPATFALTFLMWCAMMAGMMLPSATPMVLTFATINRRKRARGQPFVSTAVFTAGYLLAWGIFCLAATIAQWGLQRWGALTPVMATSSALLGGALFIAAGLYQFTAIKHACLTKCRSPLAFVLNHWRDGGAGTLRMGLEHGFYCLGCCWPLMLLMFVGGVMNLLWQGGIAAIVLAEKLVPGGPWVARACGAAMIVFGAYLAAG